MEILEAFYPLQNKLSQRIDNTEKTDLIRTHLQTLSQMGDKLSVMKEFPEGLDWLNVSRPLKLQEDLKGKIVVLDFWTFCCINCIHMLPQIAELEHKYSKSPVSFVGVYSPKFENEKDTEMLR